MMVQLRSWYQDVIPNHGAPALLKLAVALSLVAWLSACGSGNSASSPNEPNNPIPSITSLSPAALPVGSPSQTLIINGSGFIASSTVTFNGISRVGTVINSQELSITLGNADLENVGSYAVSVANPSPGGGSSNSSTFRVQGGTLDITIDGAPGNSAPNVSISSTAGYSGVISSSQAVEVPPGTYTIQAAPLSSGSFTYYADPSSQSESVTDGSTIPVHIPYSTIIAKSTKLMDQTGISSLSISADGSTLTFSAQSQLASGIAVGDIIDVPPSTAAPDGLLRKVTSVSQDSSTVSVTTVQATIAEAFQQAALDIHQVLTAQDIASVAPQENGLHVQVRSPQQSLHPWISSIPDPCGGNPLTITESGSINVPDGFTDTGTLEVCADFQVKLAMAWSALQLQSASVSVSLNGQAQLSTVGNYSQGLFDGTKTLAKIRFQPIEGVIAGFPVVVVPIMTFTVGANGNVSASLSAGVALNASGTAGFQFSDGTVTPIKPSWSTSFVNDPVAVNASLEMKAYLSDEIDLLFYGVAGPYFKPDSYLKFSADITQNPWWTLTAGVEGPIGLKADVLGFINIGDFELGNLFDYPIVTLHANGPYSLIAATPVLSSITPSEIQSGGAAFSLTAQGSGFVPGDIILFDGVPLVTTFQDSQHLGTTVSATQISVPGTFAVAVTDPYLTGSTSNSLPFIVTGTGLSPVPGITSISPNSAPVDSGPITVLISGNGFTTSSLVYFGGNQLNTTFISSSHLSASLPATDLSSQGTFPVTVQNPAPGGGTSNGVGFDVTASVGTVSVSLTPSSVSIPAGGVQTFTAIVSGSTDSGILWEVQEGSSGGSVPSPGIYVAPTTAGTYHLIATSNADPSVQASATIQVTPPLPFKILHTFSGPDGYSPVGGLVQAKDGNLYGTTRSGGTAPSGNTAWGTVFESDTSGNFNSLHTFIGADGGIPVSALIQANDGKLYGTTQDFPNYGNVFNIDTTGNLSSIHKFTGNDGAQPGAGLVQGSDGYFYGTTTLGGDTGGGTTFRVDSAGNFIVLHSFGYTAGPDGCYPQAALVQATDGNYYGTTSSGGANGFGTIFRMTPGGVTAVIHSFNFTDGGRPAGALFQAVDGYLYGTAGDGPNSAAGEIFRVSLQGDFQVVHAFNSTDGFNPSSSLIQGADGYIYGTTQGGGTSGSGTVFRLDPEGNVTVLYSFGYLNGQSYPFQPMGGVVLANDGMLYGVTQFGGNNNDGVLFRLSLNP